MDSSEIVFPIWGKYDDATHMPNLIYQIRAYSRILSINAPCLLIIMEKVSVQYSLSPSEY